MRTVIGIVYDPVTLEIRRIIIPDKDEQLCAHSWGTDEAALVVSYVDEVGQINSDSFHALVRFAEGAVKRAA